MPLYLSAPAPINGVIPIRGDQLAAEIAAAGFAPAPGFTDVDVSLSGDKVCINVAGLTDPMPPAELRAACVTLDEVNTLKAEYEATAATANATAAAALASVVAAHVPVVA